MEGSLVSRHRRKKGSTFQKKMKKNKIEAGKWEELPMDCLVNVFGRVGLESLLDNVPLVCKSWYEATLHPFCWKQLKFPFLLPYYYGPFDNRFKSQRRVELEICEAKFIKGIIDRSAGFATIVNLYCCYSEEVVINYVADKCPVIMEVLSLVIGKFKNLESLEISNRFLFKEIVTEIGSHCKHFFSLIWDGGQNDWMEIGEEEVTTIATCLPKIKCLVLTGAVIKRENLIKILKGCVELVHFDVINCCGFDEHDEELSKLASHIPTFGFSGSFLDYDYFD